MIVHVGGKRTHKRYLLLRQRIEVRWSLAIWSPVFFHLHLGLEFWSSCSLQFPGDKPINLDDPSPHAKVPNDIGKGHNQPPPPPHKVTVEANQQTHHRLSSIREANDDGHAETDSKMIDLNMKPQRVHEQAANNQVHLFLHSSYCWYTQRHLVQIDNLHIRLSPWIDIHW